VRIRSIKPEFWRDPDSTGRWPADLKLFYIGLWCVADDDGRFPWEPDLIAADLYPYDRDADVGGLLTRLVEAGRAISYEVAGRRYGFLPKFGKHQRINRPTPSRLPPPPVGLMEPSLNLPGGLTAGEGSGNRDQGSGGEEQRSVAGAEPVADAPAPAPASPVAFTFRCSGREPKTYDVTQAQLDEWTEAFPGVDVLSELRKSAAWQDANPSKRKTHRGMAAHLVSWLGRAQDGGGRVTPFRRPSGPVPQSVTTYWHEALTADQRAEYLAERGSRWPQTIGAPVGVPGCEGPDGRYVEPEGLAAFNELWRARASRRSA
jgi:hypothetical protein